MAIVNKKLDDGVDGSNDPGNYQVIILDVPAGVRYAITNIMVCNPHSSDTIDFDLHFVPSGESADLNDPWKTCVVRSMTLPPSETFTFDSEKVVLDEFDKLVLFSAPVNGNALSATVSYLEV